ncbi:zinc ribbon domain-containing protein [Streptomyces sp. NPDC056227]|uniref:zinc ribbon domain-containing protein n=1 Tax=Streptomyces sp. NPDC056227 TaxID=3345753 RepID=UPI0035E16784
MAPRVLAGPVFTAVSVRPPSTSTATKETFHCVACGHSAHADTVGALNVLRAGLVRREAQPA